MSRSLWSKQLSPCHINVCIRTKSDNRGGVQSCSSSAKPCPHNTFPSAPVGLGITHEMLGYSHYWAHFSMVLRVLWGIHESLWNGWITYSYLPQGHPDLMNCSLSSLGHGLMEARMLGCSAFRPSALPGWDWMFRLGWSSSDSCQPPPLSTTFITMHYGYENLDPRCF